MATCSTKHPEESWVGGIRVSLEVLKVNPGSVVEVCLARRKKDPAVGLVLELARKARIKVRSVSRHELNGHLPDLKHQGVALRRTIFEYTDFESLLERDEATGPLIVLDEVTDPRNLGAILRSAWAFGARGVLISKHRSAGLTPATAKAAAGAVEHVPLSRIGNTVQVLERLRQNGYWVYGAAAEAEKTLAEVAFAERVVLVFGSEGKGIRPAVRKSCDELFSVPIESESGSLNVSVAVGIVLHGLYQVCAGELGEK